MKFTVFVSGETPKDVKSPPKEIAEILRKIATAVEYGSVSGRSICLTQPIPGGFWHVRGD